MFVVCRGERQKEKSVYYTGRRLPYLQQWLEKLQNVSQCFSHASGMRGYIFSHSDGMGSATGSWSHMLCFALSDSLLIQKWLGIKLLKNQKQVYHWGLEKLYLSSSLGDAPGPFSCWLLQGQCPSSWGSSVCRIHPVWLSVLSYPTCLCLFVVCVLAIAQVPSASPVK